jgi:hypothetical protein
MIDLVKLVCAVVLYIYHQESTVLKNPTTIKLKDRVEKYLLGHFPE